MDSHFLPLMKKKLYREQFFYPKLKQVLSGNLDVPNHVRIGSKISKRYTSLQSEISAPGLEVE